MRFWIAILALVLLGVGAWWMYSDRQARLGEPDEGSPAPRAGGAPPPAGPVAHRDSERVLEALPGDARDVLEQAERFELLALHPEGDAAEGKPAADAFHGWLVLGRAVVSDARERRTLIEELYRSMDGNPGEVADCFLPRHGLHAVLGDRTVDVVICFECLQCQVHGAREGEPTHGYLLEASEAVFDRSLKAHGLEKHRDARK